MDINDVVTHQHRLGMRSSMAGAARLAAAACSLALWGGGCATDELDDGDDIDGFQDQRLVEIVSNGTCVQLMAGKKVDAGTVCAAIDNTVDTSSTCGTGATGVMHVTYETTGGWQLERARMAVGAGLEDIPTNRRGKAKLQLYPYDSGDVTGATAHTFSVPLCQLGLDGADDVCDPVLAHISAQARLRRPKKKPGKYQHKKAWADGEMLGRRVRQGKFYTMELGCVTDEPPPPPLEGCETAFAHGPDATCFLGADFDGDGLDDGFASWGWANGPISPGTSASWPVYAAVGGCDPARGELVGNLAVSYGGSTATVVFERVGDVLLDEAQLHIGAEPLPRDAAGDLTVDPAQFGLVVDLGGATSSTHVVENLSGDVYVTYHAIACGDGIVPPSDPLASLTDEFDADTLSSWDIHRPEAATVLIDDGELVMTPNPNTWWYAADEALQVSKMVTGNFAVTTRMEVTNLAGGPTAPGAPYRIGGIMVRDPAGGPNTYHMGIGNMNQPEVVTVSKSTDEGYSEIGTTPWSGIEAEMRICRFGAEVQAFIRLPEQQWTMIDWHTRDDLPDAVAVGPIAYAGTAEPDLLAAADYVHFQTIEKIEDCWRD